MRNLLNRLGSIKITLSLLLLLAGAAAFGTFLPRGPGLDAWVKMVGATGARVAATMGLTDFYHSIWFTSLLLALVLNLLACMMNRLPGMLASLSGSAALGREPVLDLPESEGSRDLVVGALRSMGFRGSKSSVTSVFHRGASGYAFTLLAHGSILIIMAFSIFGSTSGYIATQRVYVGDSISAAYNWKEEGDRPLPFEVRVEDFTLEPHPVGVRLGIMEAETRSKGKVITTHVGGTFEVPGLPSTMVLESFDPETKDFVATWTSRDGTRSQVNRDEVIDGTGLALVPVAFATWPERQATARVTVTHEDRVSDHAGISVNHPLVVEGIRIYLTDYGQDRFGLPYVGFQFVRDPGQAGVWFGCVLFLVCVTGAVFTRHSCAVLVGADGRLLVHISSRDSRDKVAVELLDKVQSGEPGADGSGFEA